MGAYNCVPPRHICQVCINQSEIIMVRTTHSLIHLWSPKILAWLDHNDYAARQNVSLTTHASWKSGLVVLTPSWPFRQYRRDDLHQAEGFNYCEPGGMLFGTDGPYDIFVLYSTFIFQNYAVCPHKTALNDAANFASSLSSRKCPGKK